MTADFGGLEEKLIKADKNRQVNPALIKEVELFFRQNPDPSLLPERDFNLIRELTKAAQFARDKSMELRAQANYDAAVWQITLAYCQNGIKRIETNKCKIDDPKLKTLIQSHFYNYAGDYAFKLAELTNEYEAKRNSLKNAHMFYTKGVELGEAAGDKAVPYTYAFRGTVEKALAEYSRGEEMISWLQSAATDTLKSGELTRQTNTKHSGYQYAIAGRYIFCAAKAQLKRWPTKTLVEKLTEAISHEKTALEIHPPDKNFQAGVDYDTAKFYDLLFDVTRDKENAQQAIKHYELAIQWLHDGQKIKIEAARRITELKAANQL